MRPRTITRLDLLAAAREVLLREALRRQSTILAQSRNQLHMLDAYRARLAASWQDGAAVPAAQACRASQFAAGAQNAAAQIAAAEAIAAAQLQTTAGELARLKSHRRKLAETLREAARADAAEAEQRAERDRPWRPA